MDFDVSANRRVSIKESEKRDEYLDLNRELKEVMEYEDNSDTYWCVSKGP